MSDHCPVTELPVSWRWGFPTLTFQLKGNENMKYGFFQRFREHTHTVWHLCEPSSVWSPSQSCTHLKVLVIFFQTPGHVTQAAVFEDSRFFTPPAESWAADSFCKAVLATSVWGPVYKKTEALPHAISLWPWAQVTGQNCFSFDLKHPITVCHHPAEQKLMMLLIKASAGLSSADRKHFMHFKILRGRQAQHQRTHQTWRSTGYWLKRPGYKSTPSVWPLLFPPINPNTGLPRTSSDRKAECLDTKSFSCWSRTETSRSTAQQRTPGH